jgi:hypothetical protein
MWCKSCRQDVPGLVSPGENCYCCARCGSVLQAGPAPRTSPPAEEAATIVPPDAGQRVALRYDPWELNERLRHFQRVLHASPPVRQAMPGSNVRWDLPSVCVEAEDPPQPARLLAFVSWSIMGLGVGVFACGAALVGLSLVNGRSDLWRLGLPTVLAGQFALLLALALQLAGHYAGRQAATDQLQRLDEQLESIRRRLIDGGVLRDHGAHALEK